VGSLVMFVSNMVMSLVTLVSWVSVGIGWSRGCGGSLNVSFESVFFVGCFPIFCLVVWEATFCRKVFKLGSSRFLHSLGWLMHEFARWCPGA
jgi:hypothetical protein